MANKSTIAATAIEFIGQLYGVERDVKALPSEERLLQRRTRAAPIANALHDWLIAQRTLIPDGTATARAIDYSFEALGCAYELPGRCGVADSAHAPRSSDPLTVGPEKEIRVRS